MTDAHTPGPWVADEYPHGDCWQIKYGTHGNWLAEVMGDHKGAAADARLIAAAPDYHTAAREIDRLALVIESAVRFSDPTNLAAVRAALKANQAAILKATTPNAGERG